MLQFCFPVAPSQASSNASGLGVKQTNTKRFQSSRASPHLAFHILDPSPWPQYTSLCMLTLAVGLVLYFHKYRMGGTVLLLQLIFLTYTQSLWWRDVIRESIDGCHTAKVKDGLYFGMILFIVSEAMFFVGLLWAFLHQALMPTVRIGITWPPVGIVPIDWTRRPTLNTVILAASFFSQNYSKYAMEMGNKAESRNMLIYTIGLGMLFSFYQYLEFSQRAFTFSDSVFGSAFFLTTGFHGMHVIIGFLFLIVCLFQINTMAPGRSTMLELAILYWHFVDVVWIGVFTLVYVWGQATPTSGVDSCADAYCVLQNVLRDARLHSFYSPSRSTGCCVLIRNKLVIKLFTYFYI